MIKIDVKASCEKIKDRMEKANITAKQLQEKLDVTVTAPYVWLRGDGLPKLDTLLNLCELLNCTLMELLVVVPSDDSVVVAPTLLNQYYYNKTDRKECWEEMKDISVVGTVIFDLWNAYKYLYRNGDKENNEWSDRTKARNYINHAKQLYTDYMHEFSDEFKSIYSNMIDTLLNLLEEK